MNTLTQVLNLKYADTIKIRIRPLPIDPLISWSPVNSSGATVRTKPMKVQKPDGRNLAVAVLIRWEHLKNNRETGGSTILEYVLYGDTGNGYSVKYRGTENSLLLTYDRSTNVPNYKFKVRARNVYGYSEYSDELVTFSKGTQ